MDDEAIIALYWQRDETAIRETQQKYGAYLATIARRILPSREDSEESVNDTYLKAWNSIPPNRPGILATYLGRITRQLSIDIFRRQHREKRGGSEYTLSLTELKDCASAGDNTREEVDLALLGETIGRYLQTLPPQSRTLFVERYYYLEPVRDIAARRGLTEAGAKSALYRARQGLRSYLIKEGFEL